MNLSTRSTLALAGAMLALATTVPAALAGNGQPLRRGISDFTIGAQTAANVASPHQQPSGVLRRGIGDFTAAIRSGRPSAPAQASVTVAPAQGFRWTDAAIGAAVTLGAVLLMAGLAAVVVLGRPQRRPFHGGIS
jgi:hypothetical protein